MSYKQLKCGAEKKKRLKGTKIIFFLLFFFSVFFNLSSVKAVSSDCIMCDATGSATAAEKQFMDRIKIIKNKFPNQIDDIVLAATVLHNGGGSSAVSSQYDSSYKSSDEKKYWASFDKNVVSSITPGQSYKGSGNPETDKIDLLTAATIVMLDSSGWTGSYNEEKYKEFLAGKKLVGNGFDNIFGDTMNGAFCVAGAAADFITLPFSIGVDIGYGIEPGAAMEHVTSRYRRMADVCQKGYIGSVYQSVNGIEDQNVKQKHKKSIANQIIQLANYYKNLIKGNSSNQCLVGNTQATIFNDMSTDQYIETMGPIAQVDYSRSNVFASITLAQSIIESGWGKSGLTQKANNMFGIKCSSNWDGECIDMSTGEYGSGGYYTIVSAFRKYPSIESSVEDHSKFLHENERYSAAFGASTYQDQIREIHNAGYATAPDYSSSIINTVQMYNLDKWDVKTNSTSSNNVCSAFGGEWQVRTVAPTASDKAFNYVSSNRGQCVWYAQGRAIEIVEELGAKNKLTNDQVDKMRGLLLQALGNGGEIYDNAVARGSFNTSNDYREPKPGSFIVWKQPGAFGHVGVIEEVNESAGTVTITDGWSNIKDSCPNLWSCVSFRNVTMDLETFYNYAQNYIGGYNFSGYVYFLEPK